MPTSKPSRARTQRTAARVDAPSASASDAPVFAPLAAHVPFEQAAAAVLSEFQHAIADLFAAAPDEIEKIADVESSFGVNHLLAWQLFRIVHAHNPLAAGLQVPAAVSIRKLLTAAARRKVPAAITDRIAAAFEAFEHLVRTEAGDRDEMDAMLSAFLPEERRKQDLAARQAAFKGMSQIKGVAAESMIGVNLIHPSGNGKTLDRAIVACELGLRRLRPDANIVVGTGDVVAPDSMLTAIDGSPAIPPLGSLLPQFSTTPLPRLEPREIEGMVCYRAVGENIAMRSAIDLVTADRRNHALPAYLEPDAPRYRGYARVVSTPAKRLTIDLFVHKDAYPDAWPRLHVYDTSRFGFVSRFDDPSRADDLLTTHDELRRLPPGLAGARMAHMPRYVELLEYSFAKLGWNPAEFRAYRLDVQYPVFSAVYMLGLEVPASSSAPSPRAQ